MNRKLLISISLLAVSIIMFSCKNDYHVDTSKVAAAHTHIVRYEEALFSQPLNAHLLDSLQSSFPLFLGTDTLSTAQIHQLQAYTQNPFLDSLYAISQTRFPTLKAQEATLSSAFQHIKYYYPSFKYPQVFTYISGKFDETFLEDSTLVISIDRFLGPECPIYTQYGIPKYRQQAMQASYIPRNVLKVLAQSFVPPVGSHAQLLDHMLYEAKILLFIQHMQPNIPAEVLFDQNKTHLQWLKNKESAIWRYYAENELLFKLQHMTYTKCIGNAPFSSIFGQDSAPRTGIWIGYQILKAYQKNNKLNLIEVLQQTNSQTILQESGYKPKA